MKELSGTKHWAVDLDPLKCNVDQQSKEVQRNLWHSVMLCRYHWKMWRSGSGAGVQGSSLIRQHIVDFVISDLISKHRWLLFVVAVFILFFFPSVWRKWTLSKRKTYKSCLSSRVVFFFFKDRFELFPFFSKDRFPRSFSFLLLIKPPSVVLLQLICSQTVFNISC